MVTAGILFFKKKDAYINVLFTSIKKSRSITAFLKVNYRASINQVKRVVSAAISELSLAPFFSDT
jgi:hypothetical protein